MQKIWNVKSSNEDFRIKLCNSLNISPIFAQILINRNLQDPEVARRFLYADISNCYDPFLLKGMDKASHRIKKAIENKEKILIYGDYDVDGITSSALLKIVLGKLGGDIHTYIPNRLEEGYGLNPKAVKFAIDGDTEKAKESLKRAVTGTIQTIAEVKGLPFTGPRDIIRPALKEPKKTDTFGRTRKTRTRTTRTRKIRTRKTRTFGRRKR